jgi:hypothetical protein
MQVSDQSINMLPGLPPPWMELSHGDSAYESFALLNIILFLAFSFLILITFIFCYFKYVQNSSERLRNEELKIRKKIALRIGPEAYWASTDRLMQLISVEKEQQWQNEIQRLEIIEKERFRR